MKGIVNFILFLGLFSAPIQTAWGQDLIEYYEQGVHKEKISDFKGALEAWEKGLILSEKMDNKVAMGICLDNIGRIFVDLHDNAKALIYLERALEIHTAEGEEQAKGHVLNNIGVAYNSLNIFPKLCSFWSKPSK